MTDESDNVLASPDLCECRFITSPAVYCCFPSCSSKGRDRVDLYFITN